LTSLAASSAPCRASAPAAALSPDFGTSTPIRTSATELVPPSGSEEVQAVIARVTAASTVVQDKKRFLVISPKSPKSGRLRAR
jgi:hypothetical protein